MGISGRVARYFQDSQLTPLVALVAFLLGLFAVAVTPREEEPQINVTMANVFIPFPGASVADVESLVSTPAEQVLSQMEGIEHVYSVSRPGISILTVQFRVGVPRIDAIVRLRDTMSANRDWAPPELGILEPVIKPKGIDDVPVVTLALWSDDEAKGAFELERVAHALEAEIKRVSGTREVQTLGGPGRVVRVLLDADRLASHGVTALDVRNALQLSNVTAPTGKLVRDNREIAIETGNYLESAADVRSLVVGGGEVADRFQQVRNHLGFGFDDGDHSRWRLHGGEEIRDRLAADIVEADDAADQKRQQQPDDDEPAHHAHRPLVRLLGDRLAGDIGFGHDVHLMHFLQEPIAPEPATLRGPNEKQLRLR